MATKEARRIAAVSAARQRRVGRAAKREVEIEWFIKETVSKIAIPMKGRVKLATEFLKTRIVRNISRPVTKTIGKISGKIVVTDRSKKGEFPKADTTLLLKDVFSHTQETTPGVFDGFVGVTLDYGLILETNERLDRSFLRKSLFEETTKIKTILTGPIK